MPLCTERTRYIIVVFTSQRDAFQKTDYLKLFSRHKFTIESLAANLSKYVKTVGCILFKFHNICFFPMVQKNRQLLLHP